MFINRTVVEERKIFMTLVFSLVIGLHLTDRQSRANLEERIMATSAVFIITPQLNMLQMRQKLWDLKMLLNIVKEQRI